MSSASWRFDFVTLPTTSGPPDNLAAMLIRPGGAHDAPGIAALHTASWRSAYAGIMPDEYLSGPMQNDHESNWIARLVDAVSPGLFVAEDGSRIVGFVYLQPTNDGRVLLDNLHAAPDRRGRGIGSQLIDKGLTWAATTFPGTPVFLEVLRDNTAAVAFYEHLGWKQTNTGTAHFPAGFSLAEYEYTWKPVDDEDPLSR
ncbi:GNAT family N-acetyltransferase [Rhodococcus qingshengii]|uniref:GNAT family N-acetyltransferase n=1 Tax=Rhodococcus qingshengii TaxID=334542 RepID=UPI000AF761C2|nr:N-acetyltransferase [Rhodococcus qingshengii]MCZ4548268.1 N-acetyltransferase [Rhodococcus qingshengii]